MNLKGAPKRYTPAEKAAVKKQIIAGIRDGKPLAEIALSLGFNSKQSLSYHFSGVRKEALSRIKI